MCSSRQPAGAPAEGQGVRAGGRGAGGRGALGAQRRPLAHAPLCVWRAGRGRAAVLARVCCVADQVPWPVRCWGFACLCRVVCAAHREHHAAQACAGHAHHACTAPLQHGRSARMPCPEACPTSACSRLVSWSCRTPPHRHTHPCVQPCRGPGSLQLLCGRAHQARLQSVACSMSLQCISHWVPALPPQAQVSVYKALASFGPVDQEAERQPRAG